MVMQHQEHAEEVRVGHLADLHLGKKSAWDLAGAERLNSLRQALTRLAVEELAAILIAGDVFDGPGVDRGVVQEAAQALQRLRQASGEPIAVIVIPGNHDPAEEAALWTAFRNALEPQSAVQLILTPQSILLAGGKLLVEAYPCETRYSPEAPWSQPLPLPEGAQNAARVVLAHGTLQGGPVPEGESNAFPFTWEEVEALGADYVALGHFHGIYPSWDGKQIADCRLQNADLHIQAQTCSANLQSKICNLQSGQDPFSGGGGEESTRTVCYCGTHEPDQFGGDAGFALVATLRKGQVTKVKRLAVGKRRWQQLAIDGPLDLATAEAWRRAVADSEDPTRHVLRFKIGSTARLSPEEADKLAMIEAALLALGAYVDRRGDIQAQVDVQALDLDLLPSGAVREALLSLKDEWAQASQEEQRAVLAAALQLGWEKLKEK